MGAATITATYVRHGRKWRVLIRPVNTSRITRVVSSEKDAIDLVRHFNRLGMAGVDLGQALAEARRDTQRIYPTLCQALPTFLNEQVELGNLRRSTANAYKNRLAIWAYPRLGQTPWNLLTREEIGAVLLAIRKAGKSVTSAEQIRCPLTRFYQWQSNVQGYRGPNPAGDLKFFLGKQPSKRARKRDLQWFRQAEARGPLETCQTLKPRWTAFLMVCFGGGLRWGETTAVERSDIGWGARARACRAHLVRGRRTDRSVQGWRGPLGETARSHNGGAPRPPGSHGPRGQREGLAAGGPPARLPQHRRPDHALRRVS